MVPTGKAEAWIVAGRTTKIGEWVPKETIEGLYKRIEEDGLKSALCMYTATALNLHWGEGEKGAQT